MKICTLMRSCKPSCCLNFQLQGSITLPKRFSLCCLCFFSKLFIKKSYLPILAMLMAKRFEQFKDGGLERGGTRMRGAIQLTTTPVGDADLHSLGHHSDLFCHCIFHAHLIKWINLPNDLPQPLGFNVDLLFTGKALLHQFWTGHSRLKNEVNFAQWRYSNQ